MERVQHIFAAQQVCAIRGKKYPGNRKVSVYASKVLIRGVEVFKTKIDPEIWHQGILFPSGWYGWLGKAASKLDVHL